MNEDPSPPDKWHQWPSDVPRPTPGEFAAAEARHKAAHPNRNGLVYEMLTVAQFGWWRYFFPETTLRGPSTAPDLTDEDVIAILRMLYTIPKEQLARVKARFTEEQIGGPAGAPAP